MNSHQRKLRRTAFVRKFGAESVEALLAFAGSPFPSKPVKVGDCINFVADYDDETEFGGEKYTRREAADMLRSNCVRGVPEVNRANWNRDHYAVVDESKIEHIPIHDGGDI